MNEEIENGLIEQIDAIDREIRSFELQRSFLDAQVVTLKADRELLMQKKQRSRERVYTGPRGSGMDEFMCNPDPLIPLIESYLKEHDMTRIMFAQRCRVSTRTLREIVKRHRRWITLETADRILSAMHRTYVMHELDIRANPRRNGYKEMDNIGHEVEGCG